MYFPLFSVITGYPRLLPHVVFGFVCLSVCVHNLETKCKLWSYFHTFWDLIMILFLQYQAQVRVVVISLSFPSFNPQSINPSNSLVIVLLLMLPLFGMLFLRRFVHPPLSGLLQKTPQNLPLHQSIPSLVLLTSGILRGAWTLFCPWMLKLVDCFRFVAP